jgi:uncharacterized protein (TIGR02246 family)
VIALVREQEVREKVLLIGLFDRLMEGWNREDADTFASVFTDDAVFVAFDGTTLLGRAEIAEFHRPLFATHLKGMRLSGTLEEVRYVAADVSILLMLGATTLPGKAHPSPTRDSVQTLTAIRQDGQWSFATFQNTRLRPIRPGASFFAWLVADAAWRLLGGRGRDKRQRETSALTHGAEARRRQTSARAFDRE